MKLNTLTDGELLQILNSDTKENEDAIVISFLVLVVDLAVCFFRFVSYGAVFTLFDLLLVSAFVISVICIVHGVYEARKYEAAANELASRN